MLIYDSQKKFLGIDERDLNQLGFSNLKSLVNEVDDFADLFVKTPGFIHNFKHVHWIDFVACANPGEESQAIISVNNKLFKCRIEIETLFLVESASAKSFMVSLVGLRELSKRESQEISGDITVRPSQIVSTLEASPETIDTLDEFDVKEEEERVSYSALQEDPYETPLEVDFESDDDSFDKESEESSAISEVMDNSFKEDMIDVGDLSSDDVFVDEEASQDVPDSPDEPLYENYDNGYVYDPRVASDELGLPLDLIEEFIQDFIAQAKEFKPKIYDALDSAEFDQVKILSHKLKGVAANLRIEDAFEALSVVNTSQNSDEILENLDTFYKIIAKLAGEEVLSQKRKEPETKIAPSSVVDEPVEESSEDLYDDLLDVDFEDDFATESVHDDDVPQKIDVAELADDDFVSTELDFKKIESDIEEISDLDKIDLVELDDEEIEVVEDNDKEFDGDIASDLDEFESASEDLFVDTDEIKERAAAEIGIDKESYLELFDEYVSESSAIISSMKKELENGDLDACRYEAMKLQGMSENMRINSFEKELELLVHSSESSQTQLLLDSLNVIQERLLKISKAGA